ncbi:glycosyltransferase family 4 protein [Erythrobacter sp. SDW2]|uniref:glycosyltransferase family 4 protein n=1 Tax=Erythrobacter sp. SDW2 TaxID=2907154 RepID=UPI001F1A3C05|nr:glycosyltransferase family 4 protein [Erythrobacter sp. SDW2]UIP06273.1 glycosyltransferase family 4 protein [Erythrobacter sp. SDW2]
MKQTKADPVRFLHLHSTFSAGGKELRCVQLINAFGPGVEHSIVSGVPGATGAAQHIAKSARVRFPDGFPSLQGKPWPWRLHRLAQAMKGYDLVLTYNWGAMDAVMAHTLFSGPLDLPPLVHHSDGFNEDEQFGLKPSRNLYHKLALGKTHRLVVPSQTLEAIALEVWEQPFGRVANIPNGIDTMAFAKTPARNALPGLKKGDGELWVGTLAGLRPVKNLPRLVRAFAAMPEPWKLVIVGEGPEEATIRAEAGRLGIAARVLLPGFAPNPSRYVGLFDIFALSSNSEQFPISVVEAMAAGLPVVAPAVGDIANMVAEENTALVSQPGDEAALEQALLSLAADPDRRVAIGAANRLLARARYDESAMIAAYRRLYGGAIGRALPG